MMRAWIGLLAGTLVLSLAPAVPAQEAEDAPEPFARRGGRGRTFWRNPQTVELLALTPEQCGQLEEGEAEFAARTREISQQMEGIREELEETLAEDRFSPEKANRLRDEIAKLAAERSTLATGRLIDVRRVLTAEQWAELKAEQEARMERQRQRRQRMEQRMGRGERGGPRGEPPGEGGEPEPAE